MVAIDRIKEASNALGLELAAEVVRTFGKLRLCVTGTSMVPAVHPGDLISVERTGVGEVSPGEIVVFAREGRLVTHRVVARAGSSCEAYLVTRGDRTRRNDPLVSGSELLGRVTSIDRGHRRFQPRNRLATPQHLICRLLCYSDRATSLFLRLATLWRALAGGGAEWQA